MMFCGYGAAPAPTKKASLAPALLGAGGGFMVAGPIGGVVGGIAGYLLSSVQAAKQDEEQKVVDDQKKAAAIVEQQKRDEAKARLTSGASDTGGASTLGIGAGAIGTGLAAGKLAATLGVLGVAAAPFAAGVAVMAAGVVLAWKLTDASRPSAKKYKDHWDALPPAEKSIFKSLVLYDSFPPGYVITDPTEMIFGGRPTVLNGPKDLEVPYVPGMERNTWGGLIRVGYFKTREGVKVIDLYNSFPDWESTPVHAGAYWTLTPEQRAAQETATSFKIAVSQGLVTPAQQAAIEAANMAASAPIDVAATTWGAPVGGGARPSINGFGDLSVHALRIAQSRSRGKY